MTTKQEREEAITQLRELLPPGTTITTILRHVSRSGMMRVVLPTLNGERIPHIEEVTQFKYNRNHDGYTVSGCGTDVGFELVYNLSSAIYRDGYDCLGYDDKPHGERCPSSDHVNHEDPMPTHHKDGYALRQRWI